jgi:hypothetical protein
MRTNFFLTITLLFAISVFGQTKQQPQYYDLYIDKLIMHQTPQSGTWLFCFQAKSDSDSESVFHISDKTYENDGITIDMKLKLSDIIRGEKISFKCRLDDDESDVCAESAEDKSNGEFMAKKEGSKQFSFDNWSYTIYWHLEEAR